MSRAHDAITEALAAEISRHREWDELPALYNLYLTGAAAVLRQVPLPDGIWAADPNPVAVLSRLADVGPGRAAQLHTRAPAGLHGVAFFSEGWRAVSGRGGRRKFEKQIRRAGVENMRGRVEGRGIFAVDRTGTFYDSWQERGCSTVQHIVETRDGCQYGGEVAAALDRLVSAYLGVPLQGRPRRRR